MKPTTFAVLRLDDPRELRLSGLRPVATVAAEGDTPIDLARSLEAAARHIRAEWRRVLHLPAKARRRLQVVNGGRRGRL